MGGGGFFFFRLNYLEGEPNDVMGPVMLRFNLQVSVPTDTFLDMQEWGKGIVFINGFNIGRYSTIGPIHTLYAPSPLFRSGTNEVLK